MYSETVLSVTIILTVLIILKFSKKIFCKSSVIIVFLSAFLLVTACGGGNKINLKSKIEDIEENTLTRIADLPFMKGTKVDITKSIILGEGMSWSGQILLYVPKKKVEIFNYYVKNLDKFDWKEQTTIRGETSVLNFLGPNNRVAIITIQRGGFGKSIVTISVAPYAEEFEEAMADSINENFLDIEDFKKN